MKLIQEPLVGTSFNSHELHFLLLLGEDGFQISLSAILASSTFTLLSSTANLVYIFKPFDHLLFGENIVSVSVSAICLCWQMMQVLDNSFNCPL